MASVFQQERKPDEILLIDDGALDGEIWTEKIRSHGIQAEYYRKASKGLTRSRNLGASRASGDIFLFLDDDVTLDSKYILGILGVYEEDSEKKIGGVSGVVVNGKITGLKKIFLRLFCLDSKFQGRVLPSGACSLVTEIDEPMRVDWLSGCGMSYRREVFQEFSFDEKFAGYGRGEDRDFSYRVGRNYFLFATPNAILEHHQEQGGRSSSLEFGQQEIRNFRLFFEKNMPKRPRNYIALHWAIVGMLFRNLLSGNGPGFIGNLKALMGCQGINDPSTHEAK